MTALWITLVVVAWVAIGAVVAVLVGRAARLREKRDARPHTNGPSDSEDKAS
ncbi:hypothetical protein [Williamsia muralis]|uniref:hypothetical protein n=1 Tax=Williamsia marianensis TaxID=85044 RepID=UPI001403320B|nr:hypothetical protein [Williamsia marianensis]